MPKTSQNRKDFVMGFCPTQALDAGQGRGAGTETTDFSMLVGASMYAIINIIPFARPTALHAPLGELLMIPYFYQARLSSELITHIVDNASSFEKAMRTSVEAFGGQVIKCALIASSSEPAGFLEFPDETSARAWSVFYLSQEGVISSSLHRLHTDESLQMVCQKLKVCSDAARSHRS